MVFGGLMQNCWMYCFAFQLMMIYKLASCLWASFWKSTYSLDLSPHLLWLSEHRLDLTVFHQQPSISTFFCITFFESSYYLTSGYSKPNEGLWAADLSSGFLSFCSQGAPHRSSMCPALQLLLTSPIDDSLHQCGRKSPTQWNTVLNLLNIFSVIYAPLPHSREAIHRFNTLYVKGKSCTGTHHIKGPVSSSLLTIYMWGLFTYIQ